MDRTWLFEPLFFGAARSRAPRCSPSGSDDVRQLTSPSTQSNDLRIVDSSEWAAIGQVVDRMKAKYPTVPPDTVTTVVHRNHARFEGRPIREFVPLFVERGSRDELSQIAS